MAHPEPAQCAGGYDWLETWRRMYDAEREQGEAATDPNLARSSDCWVGMAARFAAVSREAPQPDAFMQWLLPQIQPGDRVIDIGAGTGRYAPVLAMHAREVLALEPSESMRGHLAARIADEHLANVQIVADSWPAAAAPVCDIAFSAHVVYGVREIGPFLAAMNHSARRLCALYLMIEHSSMFISTFWERFHGHPRLPLPAALECLGALYQLGYPASFVAVQRDGSLGYPDEDAALEDIRVRLRLAPDLERDAEIRDLIRSTFTTTDSRLFAPPRLGHAAILWWTPKR